MTDAASVPTAVLVVVYCGLFVVALILTEIDTREHRLPNRIVFPTALAVVFLCFADAIWRGDVATLTRSLLGGWVLLGGYWLLYRGPTAHAESGATNARGMGGGDVKLAFPLGMVLAWHGWVPLLVGTMSAFVLAGTWAVSAMVFGRANRDTLIAFGPFMMMGAVIGVATAHETSIATIVGV